MKNLHLLQIDTTSKLVKIYNDVNRETFTLKLDVEVNDSFKEYVNVYITSDEEIKEGDVVKIPCGVGKVKELFWKFGNDNPSYIVEDIFIYKLRYGQKEGELQINSFRYEDVKKITLTTDQDLINDGIQAIDDEFLEWFVKNPSCEFVMTIPDVIGLRDVFQPTGKDLYKIIIPKEETKPKTMLESLQEYFKNTPKEKVLEDWNEFQHLDEEGITVKEFLENQKQETLEEAAEKYSENWEKITGLDYENTVPSEVNKLDFINGAKWQQERMYSEEEVRKMFSRYNEVIAHRDNEEWQAWIDKQFKKK